MPRFDRSPLPVLIGIIGHEATVLLPAGKSAPNKDATWTGWDQGKRRKRLDLDRFAD